MIGVIPNGRSHGHARLGPAVAETPLLTVRSRSGPTHRTNVILVCHLTDQLAPASVDDPVGKGRADPVEQPVLQLVGQRRVLRLDSDRVDGGSEHAS